MSKSNTKGGDIDEENLLLDHGSSSEGIVRLGLGVWIRIGTGEACFSTGA